MVFHQSQEGVKEPICNGINEDFGGDGSQKCEEDIDVSKIKRKFKSAETDNSMKAVTNKKFMPQSQRKMQWATTMYNQWWLVRLCNHDVSDEIKKADLFKVGCFTQNDLCYALSRFIREIKKLDGSDFPPNTLREVVYHDTNVYA